MRKMETQRLNFVGVVSAYLYHYMHEDCPHYGCCTSNYPFWCTSNYPFWRRWRLCYSVGFVIIMLHRSQMICLNKTLVLMGAVQMSQRQGRCLNKKEGSTVQSLIGVYQRNHQHSCGLFSCSCFSYFEDTSVHSILAVHASIFLHRDNFVYICLS